MLLTFMTIQLNYGLQISQFFSSVGSLALTFRFVDQLALVSGGRPRHTLCRAWYQEYEAMLREALGQA